jgi:hypothetical protein
MNSQKQNIHATIDKKISAEYGSEGWWANGDDFNQNMLTNIYYTCISCKKRDFVVCENDEHVETCRCLKTCDLCKHLLCEDCAEKAVPQVYEENNGHITRVCKDCTEHMRFCTKEHFVNK